MWSRAPQSQWLTRKSQRALSQLCSEFRFKGLANKLSAFRREPDFNDSHSAQARICVLEEHILLHEHQIAMLELFLNSQISQQE
jgi:hypothetical protein